MATYKHYLKWADGTPILGVQACLYNMAGQRLDVDITEENGLFYFLNVATGHYQVRFYGRDLTEQDWLEIDVVDDTGITSYPPITFIITPILQVVEGTGVYTKQGELVSASYTISNIETSTGRVASTSIYYRTEQSAFWKLLDNLTLDEGSVNSDDINITITGVAELELPNKPTLFYFKTQFFNPVGELAMSGGIPVEPETSTLFYGITDLNEYVGVTNFSTRNTVGQNYNRYYTSPTDEVICSWDDMKNLTGPLNLYNGLGNPVTVTTNQLKTITGYVIFLYISVNDRPSDNPWPYPDIDDNGKWYYLMTSPLNKTIVRIPKNKYIKIWTGFKTETTPTTTSLTNAEIRY